MQLAWTNSSQKERWKNSRQIVEFVVEAFQTMSSAEYVQTFAHDQRKVNNDK